MTKHEIRLQRARGLTQRRNALGLNRRGQPLQQRKWRHPALRGLNGKARESMRRKLLRRERVAAGLTVRGTVPQRQKWPRGLSKTALNTLQCLHYRHQRYARGLTSRNKLRRSLILKPRELAWREVRAMMNITRPEFLSHLKQWEAA